MINRKIKYILIIFAIAAVIIFVDSLEKTKIVTIKNALIQESKSLLNIFDEDDYEEQENLDDEENDNKQDNTYSIHKNITVTLFWVGEGRSMDNRFISNKNSAWDDKWLEHYGGNDKPDKRNNYLPGKFIPKENPFYFALPYNDFKSKGTIRKEALSIVYWAEEKKWGSRESMLKNRWIKITKGKKTAYAQWEDVGPFKNNDGEYVFGKKNPRNRSNKKAGIDVSPAVHDFLELKDIDSIAWQFIDKQSIPNGPWKEIVTTSQIYWE